MKRYFYLYFYSLFHTGILNARGAIALQERTFIIRVTLLMLIVVIPVFLLTCIFVWKYRARNTKALYSPDYDHNNTLEFMWWAVPAIIIIIISSMTWKSSHDLDPYKPLTVHTNDTEVKPLTIQVVALPWKWLFIYPDYNIATVNYINFPENTPLNFKITADAPMNSFWIPELGGQMYAMPGMTTELHLIATEQGTFNGLSANISGRGFSGMKFIAISQSNQSFQTWIQHVQDLASTSTAQNINTTEHSIKQNILTLDEYTKLAAPSENVEPQTYASTDKDLYTKIVMKFMMPHIPQQDVIQNTAKDHNIDNDMKLIMPGMN